MAQTLTPDKTSLSFCHQPGTIQPSAQEITISSSPTAAVAISASSNASWLVVASQSSSTTPSTFLIGVNLSLLSAGTYNGKITFTSTAAGYGPREVNVTLQYGGCAVLAASPTSLVLQAPVGGSPVSGTITVSSGTTATGFNASPSYTLGSGWMVVSPTSGTTSTNLTVTAYPSVVVSGTYTGKVVITPTSGGSSIEVPVTFNVGTAGTLSATPSSVPFAYTPGGAVPGAQNVYLSSSTATSFTAASNSNWLLINGAYSVASTALPANLSVTINPAGLSATTYYGNISVTASDNSTLNIPVTLVVGGSSALSISPSSLTFVYPSGTTAQGLSINSSAAGTTFTATPSSSGWLSLSQTSGSIPASLTVYVSAGGLTANTYIGSIAIYQLTNGVVTASQSVPVYLSVGSGGTGSVLASPASITFSHQSGSSVNPGAQSVVISGTAGTNFTATPSGGSWLRLNGYTVAVSGTTPAAVAVSVDPTGLTGSQSGNIAISAGGVTQNVPVTLTITSNPVLIVSPGAITVNYQAGSAAPDPSTIYLTSSGSTALDYSVATTTPWITLSSSTSTTPGGIGVAINPAGLATGINNGTITITAAGAANSPVTVPVAVNVIGAGGGAVSVTPTSLSFAGAGSLLLSVLNSQAAFTAGSNVGWVTVSPTSGIAPANLTVTVETASLSSGTHTGYVTVTVGGSSVQVPVTVTVGGGTVPVTSVSPTSLNFTAEQGGTAPAGQTVQVTSTGSSVSFSVSSSATWLSASPTSSGTPANITVSINAAGLGPGTYSGSLTISPSTGSAAVVTVRLTVTAAATLSSNPTQLAFSYRTDGSAPASQTISVASSGRALSYSVTSSGAAWLSATPASGTTPGTVTVAVNPAGLAAGNYSANLTIAGTGAAGSLTIPVTLAVSAPLPTITDVLNVGSLAATPIAPGMATVIRGTFIGPSDQVVASPDSSGRYPTSIGDTRVLFNGTPGAIIYTSATQVAAMAPFGLAGRSQTLVQVEYRGARSNSRTIAVAPAAPGLYTLNQSGSGPGAILNQDYSLNSTGTPAERGSVVQIYLTGAGQTIPAGVDGQINTEAGSTVLPVSVSIDGLPADVQYAGPAPQLPAGVVQVNAFIPAGARSGAVPIVVTVGSAASQAGVTVAVR